MRRPSRSPYPYKLDVTTATMDRDAMAREIANDPRVPAINAMYRREATLVDHDMRPKRNFVTGVTLYALFDLALIAWFALGLKWDELHRVSQDTAIIAAGLACVLGALRYRLYRYFVSRRNDRAHWAWTTAWMVLQPVPVLGAALLPGAHDEARPVAAVSVGIAVVMTLMLVVYTCTLPKQQQQPQQPPSSAMELV